MKRRRWSPDEIAFMQRAYPDIDSANIAQQLGRTLSQVYQQARVLGLSKSAAYLASPAACRLRRDDQIGAATRFQPGFTPWNKGTHYAAGGRSAETRFKPGQKPHTWHPIGTERLTKEGYLQRKMTDTGVTRRDFVAVHHLLWIEHHGPIPKGHAVCFRDGDKTHIVIDNLELVSRRELMLRNSVQRFGKEIANLVQLRGRPRPQNQPQNREEEP